MVVSSNPIQMVKATDAAVRAAQRSREAVSEAAQNARRGNQRGTVTLEEVELPVSVVSALSRILNELGLAEYYAMEAYVVE